MMWECPACLSHDVWAWSTWHIRISRRLPEMSLPESARMQLPEPAVEELCRHLEDLLAKLASETLKIVPEEFLTVGGCKNGVIENV
jgi:hypothetical protein